MNEQQLPQPYSKFKQPIEDLRSELYSADFLGSGGESNVYGLRLDDETYAVKFARSYLHQR